MARKPAKAKAGLWGGRFEGGSDPLFTAINNSLRVDRELILEDIEGSIAWAGAIRRAGVLTSGEHRSLTRALRTLLKQAKQGRGPKAEDADEDVHAWVERRLTEIAGKVGQKLHTGRSRNDQVVTDLRLWTRRQLDARMDEARGAIRSLLRLARREQETVMPGYTHLQRAQPVVLAHWCLAYVEMLRRDLDRLADARRRVNVMPLGSGALAGTTYRINRAALAKELGFDLPSRNSLDATADRDFVLEVLSAAAITSVHLSRLAEDLILFATQEFGFVDFSDATSSGSSLMPQKKNPDSAELLRGKTGRIAGSLTTMLTVCKGLPLAYNKDLQEDKEPLFDAMRQLSLCLRIVPAILDGLRVRRQRCLEAARGGYTSATELADYLVGKGVPFRKAHEIVGKVVVFALRVNKGLDELSLAEYRAFSPLISRDVYRKVSIEAGLARRDIPGGTGPRAVEAQLREAEGAFGPRRRR